ncbi:MerR-like DNA binding protein [Haloactinopolyspora alba]|uniref:MerR-like DNA binding protein n=1 Tax=Haloactinopolyspora alba TaxID=648780 RepID=A0A2P8DF20_9ACTN|nr:MerR family transcriptional regulator [Haloactinopolyspora alba]PSK95811.1 MerR-like DNA binding protein [Haloactinopolyspora alba]
MTTVEGQHLTLVDAYAAAHYFGVAPATVRQWVRRYGVKERGREKRRALYALEDLLDLTPGGN